jgi:hypothetical protein
MRLLKAPRATRGDEKEFVGVVEEKSIDAVIDELPEPDQTEVRDAIKRLINLAHRG